LALRDYARNVLSAQKSNLRQRTQPIAHGSMIEFLGHHPTIDEPVEGGADLGLP
jgi:hypothetical protein